MKYSVSSIILAITFLSYTSQAVPLLNNQGMNANNEGGATTGLVEGLLGKRQPDQVDESTSATTNGDTDKSIDGQTDALGDIVNNLGGKGDTTGTLTSLTPPVDSTLDSAEKLVDSTGATSLTDQVLTAVNGGGDNDDGNNQSTDTDNATDDDDKSSKKNKDADDKKKKKEEKDTNNSGKESKSADDATLADAPAEDN